MDARLRSAFVALILLPGLLLACGDDDDDVPSPTPTEAISSSGMPANGTPITVEQAAIDTATEAVDDFLAGDVDGLLERFAEEVRSDEVRDGFERLTGALDDAGLEVTGQPAVTGAALGEDGLPRLTVSVETSRGTCELRATVEEDGDEWFVRRLTLVTTGDCWPITTDAADEGG